MKKSMLLILLVSGYYLSNSQTAPTLGGVAASGIDMNAIPGGIITEIASTEVTENGSVYLLNEWTHMDISVDGSVYKDIRINYNLQSSRFEIWESSNRKILRARIEFAQDALGNRYFESRYLKLPDGTPVLGICIQSDRERKWNLVSHYSLSVIEPNYNQAMDVGEKSRTYSKKETLAIISNGVLYPVITNQKKFSLQFGEKSDIIADFIKSNKVNLKDRSSVVQLVSHLNEKL